MFFFYFLFFFIKVNVILKIRLPINYFLHLFLIQFCYTFNVSVNFVIWLFIIENIALNKPASQHYTQYTFYGIFDAAHAVDGYKSNLDVEGGQCTLSDYGRSSSKWQVDLEGVLSIDHISIHYATNNTIWGMDLKTL